MKEHIELLVDFYHRHKTATLIALVLTMLVTVLDFYFKANGILLAIIFSFVTAMAFFVSVVDNQKADKPIKGFTALHSEMIKEMKRMSHVATSEIESNSLVTLSFTPAFGNISNPGSFEGDAESYKGFLSRLIPMGIKVTIICYNKDKRRQFHWYWAKKKEKEESAQQTLVDKWEQQASDIIKEVREKFGYDAVREFEDIHPIFVFASRKVAFLYTMKEDKGQGKNDIVGTKTNNSETITFINEALSTYLAALTPLVQKFKALLKPRDHEGAETLRDIIIAKAHEKKTNIEEMDVLVAYGGGKDSTWALAFVRYIQELVRQRSNDKTFTLHVVTYIHPGMVQSVIENIKSVYTSLELRTVKEIKRCFMAGDGTPIDEEEILDGEHYQLPKKCVEQSKREILLLGHLSRGLGRHTFCYTCNLNMMMTIISYVLKQSGRNRIDFIVTGDSTFEKKIYRNWLTPLLPQFDPNPKGISPHDFVAGICGLKKDFDDFINNRELQGYEQQPKLDEYPSPLEIFEYTDYHYTRHNKFMDKIGFELDQSSFNFTESDCKYPAVMAYMANLRGEYKIHIESLRDLMHQKNFSHDMIEATVKEFTPVISDKKREDIISFCRNTLDITEIQLRSMVASPFLNEAEKLDDFLLERKLPLNKADIISYIQEPDKSTEKKYEIEKFFDEYIGLSISDIQYIYKQKSLEDSDNLLTRIASGDPYVKRDSIGRVIFSGR